MGVELGIPKLKTMTELSVVKFGPIEKIEEVYFESSYYWAPSKGTEKLYRFLAKTLEKTGRVAVKEAHDERGGEKENCGCAKGEMGET